MNILITGAGGYIGKVFYNYFKTEYNISLLTRKEADLTNLKQVKSFFQDKYFDIVIHCAIVGGGRLDEDTPSVLDDNLKMYYNLLECENHFNKLIHFGSGAESQESFYGWSKKIIHNSIQDKDKFYNIRILNVFDENELDYKFIKTNIQKYINKQDIEIFQNKFMDFFYMEDLVTLIRYYINNDGPKVIDCCYDYSPTLYDIADDFIESFNLLPSILILVSLANSFSNNILVRSCDPPPLLIFGDTAKPSPAAVIAVAP